MKAVFTLLGIELIWFILDFYSKNGIQSYENLFGFFSFIGLSFLLMNIFNVTFPSVTINSGAEGSSISGLQKEDLRSEIGKNNENKKIVLLSKRNLTYLIYFLVNAVIYFIIYIFKY